MNEFNKLPKIISKMGRNGLDARAVFVYTALQDKIFNKYSYLDNTLPNNVEDRFVMFTNLDIEKATLISRNNKRAIASLLKQMVDLKIIETSIKVKNNKKYRWIRLLINS